MARISLTSQVFGEDEVAQATEAIKSGWIGSGEKLEKFEKKIAEYVGADYAIAVNSGTAAIDSALRALEIRGMEVITSVSSQASIANAIISSGNKVVFADVSRENFNINASQIESLITKNTGAILPIHLYGIPAEMEKIMQIASEHDILVIEKCTMGTKLKGKQVGTFGEAGCFSLNPFSTITTGEGGFIATNNAKAVKKIDDIRNYGRDPTVTDYCYTEYGYNFKFTNLQAAIGLAQLGKIDSFIKSRRENAAYMSKLLKESKEIQLPREKNGEYCVFNAFPVLLRKEGIRDKLKSFLEKKNIGVGTFFKPICSQPYYEKMFAKSKEIYPNAEYVGNNGLIIPCNPSLTKEQMDYMAESIKDGINAPGK